MSTPLPAITMSSLDWERLNALLESHRNAHAPGLDALRDELERANVVEPQEIPPDVVTMNTAIRFEDSANGKTFELTLVYPKDAGNPDSVSVFAPVGAALLGLRAGDHVQWPGPGGRPITLKVLAIVRQPEAMGEFHR